MFQRLAHLFMPRHLKNLIRLKEFFTDDDEDEEN